MHNYDGNAKYFVFKRNNFRFRYIAKIKRDEKTKIDEARKKHVRRHKVRGMIERKEINKFEIPML